MGRKSAICGNVVRMIITITSTPQNGRIPLNIVPIGTSLATMVSAALVGTITHYIVKSGNIKFLVAMFVIAGSIVGAKIGARLANKISSGLLRIMFALLLIFAGLRLTGIINIPTETIEDTAFFPLLIVVGLIAGIASALFGIGGGVVMVPAFNLFFGLSIHEAVATSLTVILPTSFAGAGG